MFAEPDYDTLVIDYPDADVLRTYKAFISKRVVRNAHVGRQLARLAKTPCDEHVLCIATIFVVIAEI